MGTLTNNQKGILSASGFLPFEIKAFNQAKTPDGKQQDFQFNSGPVQAMIKSRAKWRVDLNKRGISDQQVAVLIRLYYRKKGDASPFDFIKAEYKPPVNMSYSIFESKRKSRERQSRILGGRYKRNTMPIFGT